MLNKRCVCLTYGKLSFFYLRSGILSHFEGFWVRCLLFLLIEGQGWNQLLARLQSRSDFPPENRIALLSKLAAGRPKDSRFFSYLPIENPSKRPGATPRGKLKSHSFRTVKMRSKIYMCQPETVLLIASQNSTSEAKGRQFTLGKVPQRLFSIDPCTYLTIYRYLWS